MIPTGLRNLLLAATALLLAGCVDVDTVIQVRVDGSGTITERVLVSRHLVAPLRALAESLGDRSEGKRFSLVDEDKLAARAAAMGDGVTMLEVVERRTEDAEGYTVRYTFGDISAVRLNQNPGNLAPAVPGGGDRRLARAEHITFGFKPGSPAQLTVRFPREDAAAGAGESPPEGSPAPDAETRQALKAGLTKLFKGLRVRMAVEVEGIVVDTDASHREGNRITLMAIDFEELLEAPAYLERLEGERPRTLEEAKKLLEDFPGIRIELAPEIFIRFSDYGLRAI